jgi:D-glycero-alpha-D-manno-heptose-7-phosphate kinase
MIIARTPFRVSFLGGGTDYPAWYQEHGGTVLASTIDKYCYLTCRHLPPFFEHRFRIVYSKIENVKILDEITHAAAREVLRFLGVQRGMEIHYLGDLPARSGIGSSSAFTVGLLHAVHALHGQTVSPRQLAAEAIHLEQDVLRETVGSQDQVLAAYGGFNHVQFSAEGEISVRPVDIPPERKAQFSAHLMLFYTGIQRTASEIAGTYVPGIRRHDARLTAINDLVQEGLSLLSGQGNLALFGELLHETWRLKRNLSAAVSSARVDAIYQDARSAGALGGKLLGAGGGGFFLLFVPPERRAAVAEKLGGLLQVPCNIESAGSRIIFNDLEPSA